MAERINPLPHMPYPEERKPETMSELQNYQPNKSPQQNDAEGSSETNQMES